jgi:bifunctional non-homologous end joining protein LigD
MLAVPGDLPDERRSADEWRFEFKWDGIRALVHLVDGRVTVITRSGQDRTSTFPELAGLAHACGDRPTILDGEIVALRADGPADFETLQARINVAGGRRAEELSHTVPIRLFAFDVLYLDAAPTMDLPYLERRALLETLGLDGPHWAIPRSYPGPGADLLDVARELGVEGVVAKRETSRYLPGRRSPEWVKVKLTRTQEVVVGGWTAGHGARADTFGALLVGVPDAEGLMYAGKVGTGFNDQALAALRRTLEPLSRPESPFTDTVPAAEAASAVWVEPRLVGEVRFTEWTRAGRLRHPAWRGVRPDKSPEEVVRES